MPRHDRLTFVASLEKTPHPITQTSDTDAAQIIDAVLTALDNKFAPNEMEAIVAEHLAAINARIEDDAQLKTLLVITDILDGSRNPALELAVLKSAALSQGEKYAAGKMDVAISRRYKVLLQSVSRRKRKLVGKLAAIRPTRDRKPLKNIGNMQVPRPRTSPE